ncbi:acyltransferase family protein [uncultured Gemella sp.]|uniref:acyltransferase family protein n=1 Tax=uncultured Gemella sp. TaxID=254352 RepID=UPI0028D2125E|nr:acyltransferase family protein [uncultured Gemella sp.]
MNFSKRNINIDIIKTLALLLVIGLHFFLYTKFYSIEYTLISIPFVTVRNITMTCVPLFIVVTGYLNKDKTWNRKYYLNIGRIYLLYSFAMFILTLVDNKYAINTILFKTTLINILHYKYYGWYINMYVGLMLIAPIINISFKNMTDITRKHAMLNIILAISIPVTLLNLFYDIRYSILGYILPNWWSLTWPLLYYIIGVCFSYNKNILNRNSKFTLKLLAITSILSALVYYKFQIYVESGLHINIFIVIITTCIFSWLLNLDINVNSKLRTSIIFVSNNTLLAYLLSYIVDNITYPFVNQITNTTIRFSLFPVVVALNFILTIILVIIVRIILSTLSKSIKLVKR